MSDPRQPTKQAVRDDRPRSVSRPHAVLFRSCGRPLSRHLVAVVWYLPEQAILIRWCAIFAGQMSASTDMCCSISRADGRRLVAIEKVFRPSAPEGVGGLPAAGPGNFGGHVVGCGKVRLAAGSMQGVVG